MDDKMKSIIFNIKTEKKRKNKNIEKPEKLEKELVKTNYSKNHIKLQSALKELNKIQIVDKNL